MVMSSLGPSLCEDTGLMIALYTEEVFVLASNYPDHTILVSFIDWKQCYLDGAYKILQETLNDEDEKTPHQDTMAPLVYSSLLYFNIFHWSIRLFYGTWRKHGLSQLFKG